MVIFFTNQLHNSKIATNFASQFPKRIAQPASVAQLVRAPDC